jgi:hypothetical protein
VDVGVKILRHVVVHNVRNPLHVDTARCDVGGDKNSITAIFEAVQRLLSLSLREVAVKRCYVLTLTSELLSEPLSGVLHLRKHDNESLTVLLKPVSKHVRLRSLRDLIHRVRDRSVSLFHLYSNNRWIVLDTTGELTDLFRHRCREEKGLPLRWKLRDDLLDIREEAHVTHAISLIEHEVLDPLKVEGARAEMVEQTTWTRHDDLRLATELRYLTAV